MEWKVETQKADVRVFDVNGKVLFTEHWEKDKPMKIQVDQWPVGIYYIKVEPEKGNEMVRKLIIHR